MYLRGEQRLQLISSPRDFEEIADMLLILWKNDNFFCPVNQGGKCLFKDILEVEKLSDLLIYNLKIVQIFFWFLTQSACHVIHLSSDKYLECVCVCMMYSYTYSLSHIPF